jgi:putative Mg2+ transporter-C (MgtC) family protein
VPIDAELILRMLVAGLIGGVLGLERELAGHEPGMRTHALVAVGAALFTVAGAYGFQDAGGSADSDPSRVAAQVAAGIGFIGAGAVLRSGLTVRGLTTAATLWVSAALGVAAGAGIYVALAKAAATSLLVLVGLRMARPRLLARLGRVHRLVQIEYERGHGALGPVMRELEDLRCRVARFHVEDDDEQCAATGRRRVSIFVQTNDQHRLAEALSTFEQRDEIVKISVDSLTS